MTGGGRGGRGGEREWSGGGWDAEEKQAIQGDVCFLLAIRCGPFVA